MSSQYHTKASNREQVLRCIFRNPEISRTDITKRTGITPATVTHICAALLAEGIILESGRRESESAGGRKRISLSVRPDFAYAIGLEFTTKFLGVCVTDLSGSTVYRKEEPYSLSMSETISEQIVSHVRLAAEESRVPAHKLLGAGIGIPGHLRENGGVIVNSNNIWKSFQADVIRRALPFPVFFENNVRCMALQQYLFHPEETPENFAFFHVGSSMYCANMTDGELFCGHTYIAGEIGHTIVNPTGLRCECGKQGCLETIASERWLVRNVQHLFPLDPSGILHRLAETPEDITVKTITAAYSLGDETITAVVSNALRYLGIAISNIAILMNPEKIFLHSDFFSHPFIYPELLSIIKKQLTFVENDYAKCFAITPYRSEDGAVGAAALAIRETLLKS